MRNATLFLCSFLMLTGSSFATLRSLQSEGDGGGITAKHALKVEVAVTKTGSESPTDPEFIRRSDSQGSSSASDPYSASSVENSCAGTPEGRTLPLSGESALGNRPAPAITSVLPRMKPGAPLAVGVGAQEHFVQALKIFEVDLNLLTSPSAFGWWAKLSPHTPKDAV